MAENLQRAVAEAAVVQLMWLHLLPAALAEILPGCTCGWKIVWFSVNLRICALHQLLLPLRLVFCIHWDGLYPVPGQCAHWDWMCRCVPADHMRYRVLTLAVYAVGDWVLSVNSEVGGALVYVQVDGLFGWCIPWHSGSLWIWAHSICSALSSSSRRASSIWAFWCWVYWWLCWC